MLKLEKVNKSFGSIKALQDISFEIDDGEFVFLMGPSGAGKSTLLKLLLREYTADSGKIIFNGVDITTLPKREIPHFRQQIGTIFQDFKVLPERTVRENIDVALAVVGADQDKWDDKTNQVLKLVGLSERSELFPAQLSGGEIQRVSLARALVTNPKLILADEPTGNLDWDTSKQIVDLVNAVNKEGKTVIMATHNHQVVERLKKRVINLKDGKIVKK